MIQLSILVTGNFCNIMYVHELAYMSIGRIYIATHTSTVLKLQFGIIHE